MPLEISVTGPAVAIMGRTAKNSDGSATFGYPGVTFSIAISGGRLNARARSTAGSSWLGVRVDGKSIAKVRVPAEWTVLDLVDLPAKASGYLVEVAHLSESWHGLTTMREFGLSEGRFLPVPPQPRRKILVMGDSVTCGEAIDRVPGGSKSPAWWNARESYGMLVADALAAQAHLVCWGGRGLIRTWDNRTDQPNLGDFYEYAVGEGEQAAHWEHHRYQPDLIISAIGTNDFSPGVPERDEYVAAYVKLLRKLRNNHPNAEIVLTEGSMLGGREKIALTAYIRDVIERMGDPKIHHLQSQQYSGDALDFHPTKDQHAAMAADLLPDLRRIMNW
jgi:lysophospholipase L1-like esterase